jgi:hypothetical protein
VARGNLQSHAAFFTRTLDCMPVGTRADAATGNRLDQDDRERTVSVQMAVMCVFLRVIPLRVPADSITEPKSVEYVHGLSPLHALYRWTKALSKHVLL